MLYEKLCIAVKYGIREISRNAILLVEHMTALLSPHKLSHRGFHLGSIIRPVACYQREIKKYNCATCASRFTGKTLQLDIDRDIDRACTFRFSYIRTHRSAFIDNVDVERNKAAVIAELTYGCVCSLAPGDAATLISKAEGTPQRARSV